MESLHCYKLCEHPADCPQGWICAGGALLDLDGAPATTASTCIQDPLAIVNKALESYAAEPAPQP